MISAEDRIKTVSKRPAPRSVARPRIRTALILAAALIGSGTALAQQEPVVIGGAPSDAVTVDLSVIEEVRRAPAEEDRLLFPGTRRRPGEPVRLHPPRARAELQAPGPRIRLRPPAQRKRAAPRERVASKPLAAPRPTLKPPPRPRPARAEPMPVTPPPPAASAKATPKVPEIPAPPPMAAPARPTAPEKPARAPTPPVRPAPSADVARVPVPEPPAPAPAKSTPRPETEAAAPPPPPPPAEREPAPASAPERQTASLPPPAAPAPAPVFDVGSTTSIAFDSGSASIGKDGESTLAALARALSKDPQLRLELRAYAAAADNNVSRARRLSLSRALAIRSYLIKKGVRSTRIDVRALGNKVPEGPADRVDLSVRTR